jgi:hypothetical protein
VRSRSCKCRNFDAYAQISVVLGTRRGKPRAWRAMSNLGAEAQPLMVWSSLPSSGPTWAAAVFSVLAILLALLRECRHLKELFCPPPRQEIRITVETPQKTARQPAAQGSQRREAASGAMSPPTPSPPSPTSPSSRFSSPGQTSTVSSGARALSEYAENAESPTRVNPSRAVTPPETTAPSRQPAAPSLPQRRLRRQGVSGCQHLYFNKAKNSYGHNYECSLCGRQWYQPWHPNATGPISQRECIILSDPPH